MEKIEWPYKLEPLAWGAESNLYITRYMGLKVVLKHRFKKVYMNEKLSSRIIRYRTENEAKLLVEANQAGVRAPLPLYVNPDKGILVIEYIEGELLSNYMNKCESEEEVAEKAFKLGLMLARLHNINIIHGDPTTSNVILIRDGNLCLIDFGLAFKSSRIEDKAVDIRVLERAVESSHPEYRRIFMESFLKGYRRESTEYDKIVSRFERISLMGRYVSRRRRVRI